MADEKFPVTVGPFDIPLPDALEYDIPLNVGSVDTPLRGEVVVYVGLVVVCDARTALDSTD